MDWQWVHSILVMMQHVVSFFGILIIVVGVLMALGRYLYYLSAGILVTQEEKINEIRLHLGRTLTLGLEFIVAADLIGTTTTPDYYTVGLLAIVVAVRTVLSFSINREIDSLSKAG